jgi:hypothetical protein
MYLELSLYLNQVRIKFSSHKQSNINRSTKIVTHFKQNSWNTVMCSQKFVQIAATTIHLTYKQCLHHFNDLTVHVHALSDPITSANISPSRTTAHLYSRNHHFLTGSTRSVVSILPTSNTIDVLKSHPL